MQKGFIGLALRNEELLKSNDQLKPQLDVVLKELNLIKQEREEKEARKQARASRKRIALRILDVIRVIVQIESFREIKRIFPG